MPHFIFENTYPSHFKIAGIDEVGCGPWAGPLIACACIIEQNKIPQSLLMTIDDSKKIAKQKREDIYQRILEEKEKSLFFGIGIVEIDIFNQITLKNALPFAMKESIHKLPIKPDQLLIDGIRNPQINIPTKMIKKGDQESYSIAIASIIAKVTRDNIMTQLHEQYPEYGWDKNAGYGTKQHMQAIKKYGLTPQHRTCFKPIQKFTC